MLARLRYLEEQTYPLVFSQELTPSEPALVSWTIDIFLRHKRGFPNSSVGKESACNIETQESLGWEDPLEKGMATTPVFLPGQFHGQRTWWATVHGVAKSRTRLCD